MNASACRPRPFARPLCWLALPALAAALPGCGGLLHSDAPVLQAWALDAPAVAAAAPAATQATLRVLRPQASPALDTDRIALRHADRTLDYYAANRWPGRVPELLQSLVIDTLRAAGSYRAVQPESAPFAYDETLQVEVHDFQAEYAAGGAPQVRVTLECTLGRRGDAAVLATFRLAGTAAAAGDRMRAIVAAFDAALGTALAALPERLAAVPRPAAGTP